MNNPQNSTQRSPVFTAIVVIAAIIAIGGVIALISARSQQSDPTLTKAPPVAPNLRPLGMSPQKRLHPGPMFTVTKAGAVRNESGGLLPTTAAPYPAARP